MRPAALGLKLGHLKQRDSVHRVKPARMLWEHRLKGNSTFPAACHQLPLAGRSLAKGRSVLGRCPSLLPELDEGRAGVPGTNGVTCSQPSPLLTVKTFPLIRGTDVSSLKPAEAAAGVPAAGDPGRCPREVQL